MRPEKRHGLQNKIAVILAGGESSRFGSNKAFAKIGNQTFLEKLVATLTSLGFDIFLSVSDLAIYKNVSLKTIPDVLPKEGPLQALYSVFSQTPISKCLLVSCDIPFVFPEILMQLWEKSEGFDICLPSSGVGDCPFPAVYSKKAGLEAEKLLRSGKKSLKSLLESNLKIKRILNVEKHALLNINTEEDRLHALSIFSEKK